MISFLPLPRPDSASHRSTSTKGWNILSCRGRGNVANNRCSLIKCLYAFSQGLVSNKHKETWYIIYICIKFVWNILSPLSFWQRLDISLHFCNYSDDIQHDINQPARDHHHLGTNVGLDPCDAVGWRFVWSGYNKNQVIEGSQRKYSMLLFVGWIIPTNW